MDVGETQKVPVALRRNDRHRSEKEEMKLRAAKRQIMTRQKRAVSPSDSIVTVLNFNLPPRNVPRSILRSYGWM